MSEVVNGITTIRKTTPCAKCGAAIIAQRISVQAYTVSTEKNKVAPLCSISCRDEVVRSLAKD